MLTGFKFIADIMNRLEGKMRFIGGGEESYGYLAGEFVRDKDAVMSCALIADIAAWAESQSLSLYELVIRINQEFGLYHESLMSIYKKGKSGAEEIAGMMEKFRNEPPVQLGGSEVVTVCDYLKQVRQNAATGETEDTGLPVSNVLQYITADQSKISIRPSGTEPKIKFYFSVKSLLENKEEYTASVSALEEKIERIKGELDIL